MALQHEFAIANPCQLQGTMRVGVQVSLLLHRSRKLPRWHSPPELVGLSWPGLSEHYTTSVASTHSGLHVQHVVATAPGCARNGGSILSQHGLEQGAACHPPDPHKFFLFPAPSSRRRGICDGKYPPSRPVGSGFEPHWRLNDRLSCSRSATALKT